MPEIKTRYRRVIIVGDVHGCLSELQALLDKCYYRRGVDVLIFVGDLVNKGPTSLQTVQFVRDQGALAFAVRGNHDDAALAAFRAWRSQGEPPKEKYAWVKDIDAKEESELSNMPLTLYLPAYNVTVVHAGFVPHVPIQNQLPQHMLTMRDVVPTEYLKEPNDVAAIETESESEALGLNGAFIAGWPSAAWDNYMYQLINDHVINDTNNGGEAAASLTASERRHPAGRGWATLWRGSSHVFFGHDASRRLQMEPWATGIDGGCVYGGCLLAVILPPLDEARNPLEDRAHVPADARAFTSHGGTGLGAWLVSVPATKVHSPPKPKQQPKAP